MEQHGVIYTGDAVIPSFVQDGKLFITSEDHLLVVAKLKEQIEELSHPSEKVTLIGFSGTSGAGKSTAAKILVDKYGFKRVRFADVIKKMLSVMLTEAGMSPSEVEAAVDGDLKEEPIKALNWNSPRHSLQTLGTEWGREHLGSTIWANITKQTIKRLLKEGDKVVVDDVRFQNEVDVIGELGGDVYRVISTQSEIGVTSAHVSETQDLLGQKVIQNTGSIEDLKEALNSIV
jgi:tRNA splicing ligase